MAPLCKFCSFHNLHHVFGPFNVPFGQNFVFKDRESAQASPRARVDLYECSRCGLTSNYEFSSSLVNYDDDYQNEQQHSKVFCNHLERVISLIKDKVIDLSSKITEIGCGKGYFIIALREAGYTEVFGFDASYEGEDPRISKLMFSPAIKTPQSDLLILRHVLEHIEDPVVFLQDLAKANNYQGRIYIEVPNYEWILDNSAFWDIYHEHVNYFTEYFFINNFSNAEIFKLFDDQYLGIFIDLENFHIINHQGSKIMSTHIKFNPDILEPFDRVYVWGASSKGVMICNYLDSLAVKILSLIDINPKKWDRFIPHTGHHIISPDNFFKIDLFENDLLLIANKNYKDEILDMIPGSPKFKIKTIEELVEESN